MVRNASSFGWPGVETHVGETRIVRVRIIDFAVIEQEFRSIETAPSGKRLALCLNGKLKRRVTTRNIQISSTLFSIFSEPLIGDADTSATIEALRRIGTVGPKSS